jgi:monoamine oxidase
MIDFYWPVGTHYYEPLHGPYKNRREFIYAAQNPMPNVYVVGEVVSQHQGWVEGALESVEAVI